MKRHGRRKPYTEAGLLRVPCSACDALPSSSQWEACAVGLNRPLCDLCDVALNLIAMRAMNEPDALCRAQDYAKKHGVYFPQVYARVREMAIRIEVTAELLR